MFFKILFYFIFFIISWNSGCDTVINCSILFLLLSSCAFILLTGDLGWTLSHQQSLDFLIFILFFYPQAQILSDFARRRSKPALDTASGVSSRSRNSVQCIKTVSVNPCVWHHCGVIGYCSISVLLCVSTVIGVFDWQQAKRGQPI